MHTKKWSHEDVYCSNIGASAKKCPNCGREIETNEKFCLECGAKL